MARRITLSGLVDPHTHLRDLNWAHKATFASETAAAVAGGYWAVLDMPNTPPATLNRAALAAKLRYIEAQAVCDWGLYFGAATTDNTGEFAQVVDSVCGLKMYNNATTGALLLDNQAARERAFAAWPPTRVISVHAEGETVLAILDLVRQYQKPTHFHHISTTTEIKYLTSAKEEGLPVTIGVCPHHLYLTEADLPSLGAFGLMKPGLKTPADRDALWNAIISGVVDVVESDHAPHTRAEKMAENPPFGVPGLETTLPLMLLAVREGRLTLPRVAELLAENPRRIWKLNCPPETYTRVDLDAEYVIEGKNLHTQCGWSPFEGMRVVGKVREIWIRGRRVYDGEKITAPPGFGQNLFAGKS